MACSSGFSLACCYSGPAQCNAAASVAYKINITVATVCKGITGFIDCRAAWARRLQEVARPRPVQAPARDQCRRPPAVPAPPKPADADGTLRSAQGSPKHASKPECEDRSTPMARRP